MKSVFRLSKPYRKAIQTRYRGLRQAIKQATPDWARRTLGRTLDYMDLVFVDHHIFRYVYSNSHEIAPGVWRSSQPAPYQIRKFKAMGVRTIINLRGPRDCGSYRLEASTCRRHGMTLIDLPMRSRGLPDPETIEEIDALFSSVEYPVLMHCKSGADRAGLMSALYLLLKENAPPEEALRQLSLRYGHIRQAETGVLDHFLESYIAHNRENPTPFREWVAQHYDKKAVRDGFRAKSWANAVVNSVLRRE